MDSIWTGLTTAMRKIVFHTYETLKSTPQDRNLAMRTDAIINLAVADMNGEIATRIGGANYKGWGFVHRATFEAYLNVAMEKLDYAIIAKIYGLAFEQYRFSVDNKTIAAAASSHYRSAESSDLSFIIPNYGTVGDYSRKLPALMSPVRFAQLWNTMMRLGYFPGDYYRCFLTPRPGLKDDFIACYIPDLILEPPAPAKAS